MTLSFLEVSKLTDLIKSSCGALKTWPKILRRAALIMLVMVGKGSVLDCGTVLRGSLSEPLKVCLCLMKIKLAIFLACSCVVAVWWGLVLIFLE